MKWVPNTFLKASRPVQPALASALSNGSVFVAFSAGEARLRVCREVRFASIRCGEARKPASGSGIARIEHPRVPLHQARQSDFLFRYAADGEVFRRGRELPRVTFCLDLFGSVYIMSYLVVADQREDDFNLSK